MGLDPERCRRATENRREWGGEGAIAGPVLRSLFEVKRMPLSTLVCRLKNDLLSSLTCFSTRSDCITIVQDIFFLSVLCIVLFREEEEEDVSILLLT